MPTDMNENPMRGSLTDEQIARRNVIPTNNPAGEPHRILAEEYFSEVDTFTKWVPSDPDQPGPAASAPLKPGVLREAQKISDRIGNKTKPTDPDYWGLATVMTEEEAELTSHMKVRHPMTLEQLVAASGMDEARVQRLLDSMSVKGIVEYNWENPERVKQYVLPMFVPGSAEFTVMNQRQIEEHPEIGTFFERMAYLPLTKVTKMVPPGGAGIGMHVIPVEKAIEHENRSVDIEHISHWLSKYDRYAAGACSCRVAERARDEGSADDPQNWCIGIGDMADYLVETGKGHFITYDQVIETLLQAEKNGFVHQITNIDGENKIFAICNCQVNVCHALRTSQLFNTPNMSRSAYVAHVDAEKCVACGACVEVCPSSGRKSAPRKVSRAPPSSRFPTTTTGARTTGTGTTATTTASSATRRARPPARSRAPRTCPSRAICAWRRRAATPRLWGSSSARTRSRPCAAASATAAARPPAPAGRSTRPWPSTR